MNNCVRGWYLQRRNYLLIHEIIDYYRCDDPINNEEYELARRYFRERNGINDDDWMEFYEYF